MKRNEMKWQRTWLYGLENVCVVNWKKNWNEIWLGFIYVKYVYSQYAQKTIAHEVLYFFLLLSRWCFCNVRFADVLNVKTYLYGEKTHWNLSKKGMMIFPKWNCQQAHTHTPHTRTRARTQSMLNGQQIKQYLIVITEWHGFTFMSLFQSSV